MDNHHPIAAAKPIWKRLTFTSHAERAIPDQTRKGGAKTFDLPD